MADGRFIAYLRVSTAKQGTSGLGLDAQRKAVTDYLNSGRWDLIAEVVEVESGKDNDRPKLAEALRLCRLHNATLVIAKLDRLSRNAAFLMRLRDEGVRFVAADMPDANHMVVGIMAVIAQAEREMISNRTKAALAAAKARGVKLGGPCPVQGTPEGRAKGLATRRSRADARADDLAPVIAEIRRTISSAHGIATALNARGLPATRGGKWTAQQVQRVLSRLAA